MKPNKRLSSSRTLHGHLHPHLRAKTTGSRTHGGTLKIKNIAGDMPAKYNQDSIVKGDVIITDSNITVCSNFQAIWGNLILIDSRIKVLDNLRLVGGSVILKNSEILSTGPLSTIRQSLKLRSSQILWAENLDTIGRHLIMDDSYISRIKNLDSLGGKPYIKDSEIDCPSPLLVQKISKEKEKPNEPNI